MNEVWMLAVVRMSLSVFKGSSSSSSSSISFPLACDCSNWEGNYAKAEVMEGLGSSVATAIYRQASCTSVVAWVT